MRQRERPEEPRPTVGAISLAGSSPLGTSHGQLVLRSAGAFFQTVRRGEPVPRLATDLDLVAAASREKTGELLDYHAAAEEAAARWLT